MGLSPRGVVVDLATAAGEDTEVAYARFLGRPPTTTVSVGNGSLRWHAESGGAHRVQFGVADLPGATQLLRRRGLSPEEPVAVTDDPRATVMAHADIPAIDHLVFTAPNRDHALALFGSTLDLDFRLDRAIGDGARQLFFRAQDLVVEVVTGAESVTGGLPRCALWGVAWLSVDADVTHRRLTDSGVATSGIRTGRKPGTRVFTVHDRALATRTVVIETTPRQAE
ncbi:VOC family protein [Gordonia insulae]|uniref:VOC domain-containing protein n=1 Tax=Gordonia insulae TaxID=2420509 RepID=A0A3G8JIZ4_9ACTN|nr:hypothetical protein [Gordonia insulae]AZG44449.1 hypothetical protein D7316_01035 [Gordonia insulae]